MLAAELQERSADARAEDTGSVFEGFPGDFVFRELLEVEHRAVERHGTIEVTHGDIHSIDCGRAEALGESEARTQQESEREDASHSHETVSLEDCCIVSTAVWVTVLAKRSRR